MNYWFFIIPFLAAFIGWVINKIAVWFIFHPVKPVKVLGITFHGIWPKRQSQDAKKLAHLVKEEFSSFDIEQKISDPSTLQKARPLIEQHVDDFLRNKLKEQMPMIGMFIGDKTIETLKSIFMKELETLFPEVMKHFAGNMKNELDIGKIVEARVIGLSSDKLQAMLAKELRWVAWTGAITGFLIGLIQLAIALLII